MGKVKGVIAPENISMNCALDACPPKCPLPGHSWQSVCHKDETTWLAFYRDTINGEFKYIFLSAGSSLKGQSDREKFEKARELKKVVGNIRKKITSGLRSNTSITMQQNTALWFIDLLAIRAGNEKDTAEEADTVGCCSLRVEHITLSKDEEGPTIMFNFLGKDSIEYKNTLKLRPADEAKAIELEDNPQISFVRHGEEENFAQVFKNMERLVRKSDNGKAKKPTDDVFDELTTSTLNQYLKELMPGLTAKVFRTFNASFTLDQELYRLEDHPRKKEFMKTDTTQLKFYNDANYQVAVLCNHSRAVSKTFDTQMEKMDEKKDEIVKDLTAAKKSLKDKGADKEKIKKKIQQLEERISKHETQKEIKQKLAGVALGTSKLNYLDPRITVAWCKKFGDFNLSKVFNKTLQTKFKWAIDEADENFRF
uniref:DNA topoisomerase 1 n=1 Tax=Hemiselmis andersenii TaxID=464988 RepID=A0A6T8PCF5_HEMAN|mmetsp:Transcript_21342/g.49494  ORF Transcript_21342/g.49494 Transcript_21342/m.49494 type:complete len:424 (+) Transcript_21342:2-1273(+)